MHIVIPTMGRVDKQDTLKSLEASPYPIILACPADEARAHSNLGRNVLPVPMHLKGIAATRQYIMRKTEDEHVVMMDDDLRFSVRREDDPTKFRIPEPVDIRKMLRRLDRLLREYAHASIAMREGANRNTEPLITCSRTARVIGYQRETFFKTGVDFRNNTVMDDFEATLHLITHGYPNAILNTHVQNQRGSGTVGGAALYRDLEMQERAALLLASRYPDFVTPVRKKTKVAWGGQERTDVIVQWKKALKK